MHSMGLARWVGCTTSMCHHSGMSCLLCTLITVLPSSSDIQFFPLLPVEPHLRLAFLSSCLPSMWYRATTPNPLSSTSIKEIVFR